MFDVFSIVPVYAFVGEEPHVTYRILLNVEDSAVTQSVFYSYVRATLINDDTDVPLMAKEQL